MYHCVCTTIYSALHEYEIYKYINFFFKIYSLKSFQSVENTIWYFLFET